MSDHAGTEGNTIFADVEIAATTTQVWDVIADYNAMYTWAPGIEDTESASEAQQGVGAVRKNTAAGFGVIEQKVTAWNEGQSFTYSAGKFGPLSQTLSTYEVQGAGTGVSKCSLSIKYQLQDPAMAGSEGEKQLVAKLQGGLHEILGALKKRVETGELVRPYKAR